VHIKFVKLPLVIAMVLSLTVVSFARVADQGKGKGKSDKSRKQQHSAKKAPVPAPEFGTAAVLVQRGAGLATPWAVYSTRLGSPVGDTTGGTFRFTCSASNAPCRLSVAAAVLSDGPSSNVYVWPRVILQKQPITGGPQSYCEYGDGVNAPDPFGLVQSQPSSSQPTMTPLTLHIGGSADCGGPVPDAGAVSVITVPAGYYDVFSTFVFKK
jgi:hypothetical protein